MAVRTWRLKLPAGNAAAIPKDKIVDYLLSTTHRAGKSKAAFFGKHGFTIGNWQALEHALREHAARNPVSRIYDTAYGARYVVDGPLAAPDGNTLNVRSAWFISKGATVPRFVTAHPLRRRIK